MVKSHRFVSGFAPDRLGQVGGNLISIQVAAFL